MSLGRVWLLVVAAVLVSIAHAADNNVITESNEQECIKDDSSDNFPGDLFTLEQRRHGAVLFHVCVAAYCFIIIAFVCNDYFLPSVDCICQDLNLSQDVAAATFMSLATCTPELFTNIIGTFLTESDLGVGTVVGSAVCNIMGVPACGGLAATMVIRLKVYPFVRDSIIYVVVIAVLAALLWDEMIYWYEALILVILYFVYCLIMFCDKKMSKAAKKMLKKTNSFDSTKTMKSVKSDISSSPGDGLYRPTYYLGEQLSSIERARSPSLKDTKNPAVMEKGNNTDGGEEQENKNTSICMKPEGLWSGSWWIFTFPVELALWMTVPNCRTRRKLYPLTFIMCIVWIGIASYIISWMMTIFGNTFNISDSVMGITFLAIGGSVPEASSSIINARLGIGDMTISNALGANTLDILLCLGVPWLIKTLLPTSMRGGPIRIQSPGLMFDTAAQIACVAILFVAAALNKFYYNRVLGSVCLFMYLAFIGFIIMVETNVFGWTHREPTCS